VPSLFALAAGGAALALLAIDRRVDHRLDRVFLWVSDAGADGARATLSVIAGSMMTVTGVVFSITVVSLTLATSQFGPRLLRNFMRDAGNQVVLGTFIGTFLFCLIVLGAIVAPDDGAAFVPHLSVTVAIVLGVASLCVLVYFIHHAAVSLQASTVIESVAGELARSLEELFPEQIGAEPADDRAERVEAGEPDPARGARVRAQRAGYVLAIEEERLLECAHLRDWKIWIAKRPGAFVVSGGTLATVEGCSAAPRSEEACDVAEAFLLGNQRTPIQDSAFLIDQLTEMAVRALSPGTNDPRTAVSCVHRLGDALATLAERRMPSGVRVDESGAVRVIAEPVTFAGLASRIVDPIRRYGAADADVVEALQAALGEAAVRARSEARRATIEALARQVREAAAAALDAESDRRRAEAAYLETAQALAGRRA
jgi:uncharacterized membrane protein